MLLAGGNGGKHCSRLYADTKASPLVARHDSELTVACAAPLQVLLVSVPENGHLIPLVYIACELARRGHQVRVASLAFAGKRVENMCAENMVEFVGLRGEIPAPEVGEGKHAHLQNEGRHMSLCKWYCDQMQEPVTRMLQLWRPSVVVADYASFGLFRLYEDFHLPVAVNFPEKLGVPLSLDRPVLPLCLAELLAPCVYRGSQCAEAQVLMRLAAAVGPQARRKATMVNTFAALEDPALKVLPGNFILTGPVAPRTPISNIPSVLSSAEPLGSWLRWVRAQRMSVVYVRMGSMSDLSATQVQEIAGGLGRLSSHAILWSLPKAQQAVLPGGPTSPHPVDFSRRFFLHDWLPQVELLQLPEVNVAVTHCGWGSLNDTIVAGKPVLAVPFGADQLATAQLVRRYGSAEVLLPRNISADTVSEALTKVLRTASYSQGARRLQQELFRTGGATESARVIEEAARQGVL